MIKCFEYVSSMTTTSRTIGISTISPVGTVQTFMNLDNLNPAKTAVFHPLGSIKLTIQKFYRINGGSTQHKGVVPDIFLPNKSAHLEIGERYLDNPLEWDTIKPLKYKLWYSKNLDTISLSKKSQDRINNSDQYNSLKNHLKEVKIHENIVLENLNNNVNE